MSEKIKRDTNADLMNAVVNLVKENGWYDKAADILDYYLPADYTVKEISNYEFDFKAMVKFGGNEGIYLDCWIEGLVDENQVKEVEKIPCGTFKTLREDLKAMRIMGELAGILTFYARKYINQNFERYCPKEN